MALTYKELNDIVKNCHKRFEYISDISNYNVPEHWPMFSEIPEAGVFKDDCDGFMQMVRKELAKLNEPSVMQTVGINSTEKINHAACRYDNWIIDNTHNRPMRRSNLIGWTFFKHSESTIKSAPEKWYKTV